MLKAAIIFFAVAILAMLFGAYGVAGLSAEIGRLLLFIFLALSILTFLLNLINSRRKRH